MVKEGDSETAPQEKSSFEDRPRMRRTGRNLPDVSRVRGVIGSMHPPHTYLTLLSPHLPGDPLGASLANYTEGRAGGKTIGLPQAGATTEDNYTLAGATDADVDGSTIGG